MDDDILNDTLIEEILKKSERREIDQLIKCARNRRVRGDVDLNSSRPKSEHIDSREAGIKLLRKFVYSVKQGKELDHNLLRYFADCFDEFLNKHHCDNEYWHDCLNTKAVEDRHNTIKRNQLLIFDLADSLLRNRTKEEFIKKIVKNPPKYWKGPPPTRDSLLKILPSKKHPLVQHAMAVTQRVHEVLDFPPE